MYRIHIGGTSLVTTDALAASLLEYARSLAAAGDADVVQLPVVAPDGAHTSAAVLVGAGIAVVAGPEPPGPLDDEALGADVVERLEAGARRSSPSRAAVDDDTAGAGPEVDALDC